MADIFGMPDLCIFNEGTEVDDYSITAINQRE